jgi:capsular exopolysaccharide synthesis family protein
VSAEALSAASFENDVRLATSSTVAEAVIDELDWRDDQSDWAIGTLILGGFGAPAKSDEQGASWATRRLEAFKSRLAVERDPVAQVITIGFRSTDPVQSADVANSVAEAFLRDRIAADDASAGETARVIGRATLPDRPSNMNGLLLLGFTAAGSCAAGIGLAFLLEARRQGYANAREVERSLGYPVISTLPLVHQRTDKKLSGRWQVFEAYGLTEAIRALICALLPQSDPEGEGAGKIVAITSSFPDEGKSTIALSLARQAGFSGLRTLFIEGDLRKPGLREGLTTVKTQYGLAQLLRSTVNDAYDCIAKEPDSGVDILLGFGPADDAFSLLRGDRMARLMQAVRTRYDLVVLDCAPIMAVSETRSLVNLVDETVFVVRWNSTERSAAKAALRDLERMGAKVAGVVLSQVDLKPYLRYADADRLAYQERYKDYITT